MSRNKSRLQMGDLPGAAMRHEGEQQSGESSAAPGQSKGVLGGHAAPEERHRHIAIAAYYRAERRGFAPGYDFDDWVQAEAEIEQRRDSKTR